MTFTTILLFKYHLTNSQPPFITMQIVHHFPWQHACHNIYYNAPYKIAYIPGNKEKKVKLRSETSTPLQGLAKTQTQYP